MSNFAEVLLPTDPTAVAPDGSNVRVLLELRAGSMAHFELRPNGISRAVRHRTVEEIWYVLAGAGEMWRHQNGRETIVALEPGLCLTIPLDTAFQFRTTGLEALSIIAVTMPPWLGEGEAEFVKGCPGW